MGDLAVPLAFFAILADVLASGGDGLGCRGKSKVSASVDSPVISGRGSWEALAVL